MKNQQGPFQRMVILGDSNAYGMCVWKPSNSWPQVAAAWLRRFQKEELTVLNMALPGNVISPRCPGYERSCKPSLLERYRAHCIELDPDIVILAQSLNDARTGMPIQEYVEDLEYIVSDISHETGAFMVLMGIYHQISGKGFNDPEEFPWAAKWDHDLLENFNQAISRAARRNGALFVDVYGIMEGMDWLLHPDCVHLNDLGHILIGNALFQKIATNTRSLGDYVLQTLLENDVSVENTGGVDVSEEIREIWLTHSEQNPELLSK